MKKKRSSKAPKVCPEPNCYGQIIDGKCMKESCKFNRGKDK